jgi:hypothetical protein
MSTRNQHLVLIAALLGVLGQVTAARAASPTLQAAKLCRKTITKQGRAYAAKRLALLDACVDKLLKCEIQLEIDGTNPNNCRSLALSSCTNSIGPASGSSLSKAQSAFDSKVTLSCAAFGLTAMLSSSSGGLWYSNDATCGTSPDIPTLAACLRGELEVKVDSVAGEVKPRAALLLDNTPLGANFPNLPGPATTSVVISATGSGGSLTLNNPGTITVPEGNALKFTGDGGGSLNNGCGGGMGMNGKLTITVGSGATAQQLVLKEPYGPSEAAFFGPYTATATLPYTIQLKDASCSDTTSGSVSVP